MNTGNITLTNVVVVSDRPVAKTTVFTAAVLAPGASANFTGTYTIPTNACSLTTSFTGTAQDICTLNAVTNTTSTTCSIATAPAITVTLACPSVSAASGGLITYTGTVVNSGNVTLNNVTVVNNQSAPSTVLTVQSLAPHASANFSTSFTTPTDACTVSTTVTAAGSDICSALLVKNTATATCPLVSAPGIVVTQICPVTPALPGGLLTYSGTVKNTGNITLTNIVVLNNLSGATPVFGVATLAAGAVANFTGSYLAPTNCSSTSTSTATGRSVCGVAVTNKVSVTCSINTAPHIMVTVVCPATAVVPGGSLVYSGTVRNLGNITLTNVVVVSDRPSANTTVFAVATLAPGASTNFTSTYIVPVNACAVSTTFSGTARDICSLSAVTNTITTACTVTTSPAIAVTLACPSVSVLSGGLITYTGTVTNSGNVQLNNVTVVNSQSVPNTVLTVASLAPGSSANFAASFIAPIDACSISTRVTATGSDNCTAVIMTNSAVATCSLITTPSIAVTQLCPVTPAIPGALLTYTGTVSNTGNVTLTNVVVLNNLSGATPIFTITTLAPGAVGNFTGSYLAPMNCSSASISTATGRSICGIAVTNTASSTCPIMTAPAIQVTQACPATMVGQGGLLTYSGSVSNSGNITLTNIIVVNNWPVPNTVVFTTATLAPGVKTNFTGSYVVPLNCCVAWSTVQARGQGCDGVTVIDDDTGTCTVLTSPGITVTKVCSAGILRAGDLLTYSGIVSNTGNIALMNVTVVDNQPAAGSLVLGPLTLAAGESAPYSGSYVVPADFCGNDTVTASGIDACSFSIVAKSATATCPTAPHNPRIGIVQRCPSQPTPHSGLFVFSGTVSNLGDVSLINVFVAVNNPTNNSPVIGPINLAPGASYDFTGSFIAPPVCCTITDTLTARGQDRCSASNVSATATSICPTLYKPSIALVQNCPANPLVMGSVYQFTGFVTNTGDAILTNVLVFSSQSGQNLPLLGPLDLAPGESEQYAGSLTVASNACAVVISVTSQETCRGTSVANTTACSILTAPAIAVTESCPPGPVAAGSSILFGGSVTNTGNITLTNVLVFSSQPSNALVLGPITLAPGASALYTGSYIALSSGNSTTNSTIVTNRSAIVTTNTALVITTNNAALVTTNTVTPSFGTIDPVSTALTHRFTAVDNLHGLMYADQDQNWGPTLFYATRHPAGGADTFDTISTIAPSAGVISNRFGLSSANYDALTLSAPDVGYGEKNFYYVRHENNGVCTFGVIKAAGASSSADLWVVPGTGYNALAFAAADLGYGADQFYFLRQDNTGLSTFGTINPTPGGIATDRYALGTNFDALVFVPGAVSSWGTGIFAYLRHDKTGSIIGTLDPVTHVVTDRMSVGTNLLSSLAFAATDVGYGPNMFYYLRPGRITLTTNIVTTFATNAAITLTTNMVTTLATNSVVLFTPMNTVTASGMDTCQAQTVTAAANCLSTVAPALQVSMQVNSARVAGNGSFNFAFQSETGKSYTVQYKNTLQDKTWTDLQTVVGTGANLPITDLQATHQMMRFYRVIPTL